MSGIPRLVTRTAWGARRPKAITPLAPEAVRFLVVHYTASQADERDRHRDCAARVRAVQTFHMESDQLTPGGASDIGYNFLVCRHGYVFKGRGFRRRQGATGPANGFSVAACFLGNDSEGRDDVTDKGRAAIREVFLFCERNAPNLEGCRGHRDFMSTACPGDELMRLVRQLDARLNQPHGEGVG